MFSWFSDSYGGLTTEEKRNESNAKPRREPRSSFDASIAVVHVGKRNSGQAIEISQSGIAIVTVADLALGEVVDLQFTIRRDPVHLRAIVRNRTGARYGLEFLTLSAEQRRHIAAACHALGVS